jgi:hypothetical protein
VRGSTGSADNDGTPIYRIQVSTAPPVTPCNTVEKPSRHIPPALTERVDQALGMFPQDSQSTAGSILEVCRNYSGFVVP